MSVLDGKVISVIGGAGMMGSAIVRGLLHRGLVVPSQICLADVNEERGQALTLELGVRFVTDNTQAVADADVLILSVKPQFIRPILAQLRGQVKAGALVLSNMAGTPIAQISEGLAHEAVVRAMPNTPAQIGQGVSTWTATGAVDEAGRRVAQLILEALGPALPVPDERYIDMGTALSGSGPAYVFLFIEAMIDAGVRLGFSRDDAGQLAIQTVAGSVAYLQQSGQHPAILRNQVTSPGGTTAAGLHELERHGLRTAIAEAVWAAYQQAIKLGQ